MSIGARIAELREKRKLTQEELSAQLGISRASLSHYEKNRREPDLNTLTKIADLFKVSIDYLAGRTKIPTRILDNEIRSFVDQLEISDEDLLAEFALTVDGRELSPEEAKRFIAFIRAERSMK